MLYTARADFVFEIEINGDIISVTKTANEREILLSFEDQ